MALDRLSSWLRPGGDLLTVHWLGETNYPRRGSDVAAWLDTVDWLRPIVRLCDEQFELGGWRHVTPGFDVSVSRRTCATPFRTRADGSAGMSASR